MQILLVDDDRVIIESIRDSVHWEKLGITTVLLAYDVQQAKEILQKKETDIIVSDIEMPRESGLDLLEWFRGQELTGKFLLLTSYEKFSYATRAIRFHAEEYLMKPFNVEMMELVLKKMICELREEREQEKACLYGRWAVNNLRELRLSFWERLFDGRIRPEYHVLETEVRERHLELSMDIPYCLVVSKVTNFEQDDELYGHALVRFILMNMQSELLFGVPENDRIICYEHRNYYIFAAVCTGTEEEMLRKQCMELIRKSASLLSATITCCIGTPCTIEKLYENFHRLEKLPDKCIAFYGETFFERQAADYSDAHMPVLELKTLESYLEQKDKTGFMMYLEKELNAKIRGRTLGGERLASIRREVQQAVYAHLAKQGIQISLLLNDEIVVRMQEKAGQSVMDMMRWESYLLERVFAYEEEMQKSQTMIERINGYIHAHYKEPISRNEIGAEFFLVPEYLAKMYKKKTGKNLKDYINEYRLERAKHLLQSSELRISEVATEVGFDNFSYFSTLFKKNTGMTPNEYRRQ